MGKEEISKNSYSDMSQAETKALQPHFFQILFSLLARCFVGSLQLSIWGSKSSAMNFDPGQTSWWSIAVIGSHIKHRLRQNYEWFHQSQDIKQKKSKHWTLNISRFKWTFFKNMFEVPPVPLIPPPPPFAPPLGAFDAPPPPPAFGTPATWRFDFLNGWWQIWSPTCVKYLLFFITYLHFLITFQWIDSWCLTQFVVFWVSFFLLLFPSCVVVACCFFRIGQKEVICVTLKCCDFCPALEISLSSTGPWSDSWHLDSRCIANPLEFGRSRFVFLAS